MTPAPPSCPPCPHFYYAPQSIDDLVEQFAYRVLAQLGLPQEKQYRWRGGPPGNENLTHLSSVSHERTQTQKPNPHRARNDQVRAFRVCAAFRAWWARFSRRAQPAACLTWRQILWIIVAMVGARSAAMTMNRIADVEYDRRNPRTANRALAAGELSVGFAWVFTALASAVLVFAAWRLNPLAFKLSPVALAILFFYSYTKRFTSWSHFVLGFCLGISPAAAWIAIRGSLDWRMLILCAAVTLWVGGFDVLYACQDVEFDNRRACFRSPKDSVSRAPCKSRAPCTPSWCCCWLACCEFPSRLARLGGHRRGRGACSPTSIRL